MNTPNNPITNKWLVFKSLYKKIQTRLQLVTYKSQNYQNLLSQFKHLNYSESQLNMRLEGLKLANLNMHLV